MQSPLNIPRLSCHGNFIWDTSSNFKILFLTECLKTGCYCGIYESMQTVFGVEHRRAYYSVGWACGGVAKRLAADGLAI
jgi:hypothetical protein